MKRFLLALALLTISGSFGDAVAQSPFDVLVWLEGDWVRRTEHGEATESWKRVSDNTMEGVGFITSGDSVGISEYLRVERFGEEVFYTAKPGQSPFPTSFLMTTGDEKHVVFENPSHDFPQRIIYTRNGDNGLNDVDRTGLNSPRIVRAIQHPARGLGRTITRGVLVICIVALPLCSVSSGMVLVLAPRSSWMRLRTCCTVTTGASAYVVHAEFPQEIVDTGVNSGNQNEGNEGGCGQTAYHGSRERCLYFPPGPGAKSQR